MFKSAAVLDESVAMRSGDEPITSLRARRTIVTRKSQRLHCDFYENIMRSQSALRVEYYSASLDRSLVRKNEINHNLKRWYLDPDSPKNSGPATGVDIDHAKCPNHALMLQVNPSRVNYTHTSSNLYTRASVT